MKAVIPAAGMGTRFLPATKSSPKEMLPVVDKPAIQYVVEEAVASGCDDIVIITGRGKRAIEDHFDRSVELEHLLRERGEHDRLREVQAVAEMADIHFIRQKEPRGLGHAILTAEKHVGGEPFAVLLGDDIVVGEPPVTRQLVDAAAKHPGSVIAVEPIPPERRHLYGMVKTGKAVAERLHEVELLVEKPQPGRAPGELGILGRYVLDPVIFDVLRETKPGRGGEIQLTDALQGLLERSKVYALRVSGTRYDLGNKLDWLKTNLDMALERPELREELLSHLRRLAQGQGTTGRGER